MLADALQIKLDKLIYKKGLIKVGKIEKFKLFNGRLVWVPGGYEVRTTNCFDGESSRR